MTIEVNSLCVFLYALKTVFCILPSVIVVVIVAQVPH